MKTMRQIALGAVSALAMLAVVGTAPAQEIKDVPRERTLVQMGWSQGAPTLKTPRNANYYNLAGEYRNGHMHHFEPLFFFNNFTGEVIPWLAESFEMNEDNTVVTIHLREGAKWSDGESFDADDVAFTYNMLLENGRGTGDMRKSVEVANQVESVEVIDPLTVQVNLTGPDPRYPFRQLINYFGHGLVWVPEHIWKDVDDPATFTWYDAEQGWPVGTGAWKTVSAAPEQIILDRRDDWWGAESGFRDLPAVERIVSIPAADNTRMAELVINNEADTTFAMSSPALVQRSLAQNDALTTFTGDQPPLGNLDWWPHSLYFNHAIEDSPFQDKRVRQAVRFAIDRQQVVDFAWDGANSPNPWPYPAYEPLVKYMEASEDILEKHRAAEHNLEETDRLMQEAGYEKNGDGMWEKDGECVGGPVEVHQALAGMGQIVVQQLINAGFCAEFSQTPESFDKFRKGESVWHIFGHNGGSVFDPVDTLRMYTTPNVTPIGTSTMFVARWSHPEIDRLVGEMQAIPPEDFDAILPLFREAMDIWLGEAVEVPIEQAYHLVPMNTTYWSNWPTQDNPYAPPCIPCFISGWGSIIPHHLEPAQS
ncbi:MAG: ABC transporter substrate-binding protein [Pseudomonadota bacterium]